MSKQIYIDIEPLAWALGIAICVVAFMWAASNADTQHRLEYQTCVEHHAPKDCK
jgi:hypothetical protein